MSKLNFTKLFGDFQSDFSEIRIESGSEKSIRIDNDEIKSYSQSWSGFSVRSLINGSWGFASTNSKDSYESTFKKSIQLAKLRSGTVSIKSSKPVVFSESVDFKAKDISELIDELIEAKKELNHPLIKSKTFYYKEISITKSYYNSEGSEIHDKSDYFIFSSLVVLKQNEIVEKGSGRHYSRKPISFSDIVGAIKEGETKAENQLKAKHSPKGKFEVVLDNEMAGVFAHEALGHATEADSVEMGESILVDKLNKQIGSELITIYDNPTADDFGNYSIDDEGVSAKKTILLDKGILVNYLNSRETAKKLGFELNGHARAESYAEPPLVRMGNTYIQPGKDSKDDIFDIKHGIYLKGMEGGSVDTHTGGFMFKSEEAYEIVNGELTTPLKDVSITGNILETLMNIKAVGKDFKTSPGFCGKGGQSVPVSDGGPHLQVSKMVIG